LLGKGANGLVCEAEDLKARNRKVAVKVLLPVDREQLRRNAERLHLECMWSKMFLHNKRHKQYNFSQGSLFIQYYEDHTGFPADEIEQAGSIKAPVIVPPLPYVIMELASGDLAWKKFFNEKTDAPTLLTMNDKRDILRQLASALEYLSRFELLHRDLHFQNIFISRSRGRSKVTIVDLGMMGRRNQEVIFVPDAEEGWKLRDWVPWEAWNLPKSNRRRPSPSARVARSPTPARSAAGDLQHWQAFDVFSLGVIHLYLCLGQAETRRILEQLREDRACPLSNGCDISAQLILDSSFAARLVSRDPYERPSSAEVLELLRSRPLASLWSWLSGSCSSRASNRSRSPRRAERRV